MNNLVASVIYGRQPFDERFEKVSIRCAVFFLHEFFENAAPGAGIRYAKENCSRDNRVGIRQIGKKLAKALFQLGIALNRVSPRNLQFTLARSNSSFVSTD